MFTVMCVIEVSQLRINAEKQEQNSLEKLQ